MRISELIQRWGEASRHRIGQLEYRVRLPLYDAARVEALRAMYPGQDDSDIMADLIHAALDELEVAMPYVPGKQVIAEDDQGDPIYEDLGPTPRFYILSHEFLRKLAETEAAAK